MYNEELKTKFIRHYTKSISTTKVCISIFNQIEPYEINWGADICTRSTDELTPVIENIIGLRERSKWMRVIVLREYVRWCINIERVAGACDGMLHVNTTGLDKVRRQMVANPLHLQKYLNQLFLPESDNSVDNTYRCYFWMAYGGIDEKDIFCIKQEDVDFNEMIIHYNGSKVPIYREAVPALLKCINLSQFAYYHPNYNKVIFKDRVSGDALIRGLSNNSSIYSLRSRISRNGKEVEHRTGVHLSYYRVWMSGIFYRTYEREICGEKPDFFNVAAQKMKDKEYSLYNGEKTLVITQKHIARDYKNDYERWKVAFGLK